MSVWLAQFLTSHYRAWLVVAGLLAAAGWPLASRLEMEWHVEQLFPPRDPTVVAYQRLQQRFGGNQLVLAVYRDPQLWDASGAGLERLSEVSAALAAVDGVASVLSLAELHTILERLRGPLQLLDLGRRSRPPLLDPDDQLAQAMLQVFEGYTHQPDSQYTAIACLLAAGPTAAGAREPSDTEQLGRTLEGLRQVMHHLPPPAGEGFITGEPVLVWEGLRMVHRDGWRLGVVSSGLVSAVLLLCFRSLRWTLIPLLVVQWSLIMTRAVLVLSGIDLTLISSTLTAIVTVIGVATSIHLLLKFQQRRRAGMSRQRAMRSSLAALLAPITWAIVTDATGFLALTAASVGPIRDFGLMMAVGSMMVLLAIVLLVPGLALLGRWDQDPRTPHLEARLRGWLQRLLQGGLAHRRLGLAVLLVVAVWSLIGTAWLQVESDYTKNFARSSPLVQGYAVIEQELGGAGVWDVMLPVPPTITAEYLQLVLALEQQLRQLEVDTATRPLQLNKVMSMADAEQASRSGPLLAALPLAARLQGMRSAMPDFSRTLLVTGPRSWADGAAADGAAEGDPSNSGGWLRIMLRSREQVAAPDKNRLVDRVRQTVATFTQQPQWQAQFAGPPPPAEVAGYSLLLGQLVAHILSDQWTCFLLATAGILLVMLLATRSWRLGLVAIVPNALPITVVLGGMGWLGVPINMGAAMIAAVSLGLSVDNSIHYLLHYRRSLQAGIPPVEALQLAQQEVGLAVVLATLALVAGFLSLTLSEFIPTVVFGSLASLTMLGGLVGNLLLLPLLLAPRRRS